MKANKTLRTACCVAAVLALTACTKEQVGGAAEESESRAAILFDTEVLTQEAPVGTTYRIMAYTGDDNINKYRFNNKTGTYYLQNEGDEELTPCKVDDNGICEGEDKTAGMIGARGRYILVAVSPGVKHNDDGTFSFVPAANVFRTSYPLRKDLGGYGTVAMGNDLKDCRATVGFEFYSKPDLDDAAFAINDLQLHGAGGYGEEVTLYPASRQIKASDASIVYKLEDRRNTEDNVDDSDKPLYYTAVQARDSETEKVYVAAGIYAPLKETAAYLDPGLSTTSNYLYEECDYLYMTCVLRQGERTASIRLPLTAKMQTSELMAQNHYMFKIYINSDYIEAIVEVFDYSHDNDWQRPEAGNGDGTIDEPRYKEILGKWQIVGDGNDWQLVAVENPPIGKNQTINSK
ncbi:hypothetical protein [uncultured Alistipes sp.]|jgi:hypothetical protein|uniref:hypothetical protein n=1 Tax=uncultured Alistipes sp. TaxID=538949 RepID=UPI00260DFFD4|nr:hypothetical protein [uncultured Alistipes sp.]